MFNLLSEWRQQLPALVEQLTPNVTWSRPLELSRSEYGLMVQMLGGLITYLLQATAQ